MAELGATASVVACVDIAGVGTNGLAEKGFPLLEEDVEKGLEFAVIEGERLVPKILLPRFWTLAVPCGLFASTFILLFSLRVFRGVPALLRPLTTLMLPSFRAHVLLLQPKMYSRLSWPGKYSGRSPCSCKSIGIISLQILHRTSAAEAGRA